MRRARPYRRADHVASPAPGPWSPKLYLLRKAKSLRKVKSLRRIMSLRKVKPAARSAVAS